MAIELSVGYNAIVVIKMHINNKTDVIWMGQALKQARIAAMAGEVPVGAVAIYDGKLIAEGHNVKESHQDPTAHAELIVLREAADYLGNWRLAGVTLYSTLEPCPMCAGAMIQARLERLVYGATDNRFGADGTVVNVLREPQFNHLVDITRGVLEGDSAALMKEFFQELRKGT